MNQAPAVDAGPDATITLPANAVVLRGSVTDDGLPLGWTAHAVWTVVSGPAPVVLRRARGSGDDGVASTDPGTYVLRLRRATARSRPRTG